jgi:hypothetical protein
MTDKLHEAIVKAALERAAKGVETLGSRAGYVDAGVTGPVTTSKAISRAIRHLASDPAEVAAIIKNAAGEDRG